ncbi:MAG: DNA replication/repair protein RecF [Caedimonas sp.]|nr:DNA replication/repair protein RecF [Caedimonas sp.]
MTSSYGLTRLVLTDFRNYGSAQLTCDVRPVILTGPNGAGKTNILEAISFLSPGRGLRRAKLSEVTRNNEESKKPEKEQNSSLSWAWGIASTLSTPQGSWDIGTGLEIQEGKERRIVKIGGEILKSQTLLRDYVHVLWVTPQMDRLFQEGAATRRRFLDRLVYGLDSMHVTRVTRYEHYMRERSRLLKYGGADRHWFDALEARMSAEGVAISAARRQFIDHLLQAKAWTLGTFPQAELALAGQIESWLGAYSALETEEKFREVLKASRQQDRESGGVACGPHRSDFTVTYREKNRAAAFCSTGEQKALLISIVFAAARLQNLQGAGVPLMLLDEIVAHFDERRRAALFEEILSLKMQAWMTGTDIGLFTSFNNKVQYFRVENAMVHEKSVLIKM